jgi:hypothetical protein
MADPAYENPTEVAPIASSIAHRRYEQLAPCGAAA